MENKKKFIKNFIWNTCGIGLNAFNSLFFLVVVTRVNGINDAGIFTLAYSTALILYTIGIYSGRLCQVTDVKNKVHDKDYIISRIISCSIMLSASLAFVICKKYETYKAIIFMLLCIYKMLDAFSDVLYGILQKNDELYKSGISLTLKSLIGIIIFTVIDILTRNLLLSCASIVILNILIMIFYDLKMTKDIIEKEKFNKENIKAIFKGEFFVFANSFLSLYILNAPKYAIDNFLTEDLQAIFGIIMMPATVITLFSQFIMMPYLNDIKKMYKDNDIKKLKNYILKISAFIISFGIIVDIAVYFIGIPILNFIYGLDLAMYRMHLIAIITAYILYAISYVNLIILTTTRHTFIQFIIYIITFIIAYITSNLLVEKFQITGAVMACFAVLSIQFLMYIITTKLVLRKISKNGENKYETNSISSSPNI